MPAPDDAVEPMSMPSTNAACADAPVSSTQKRGDGSERRRRNETELKLRKRRNAGIEDDSKVRANILGIGHVHMAFMRSK